MSAGRKIKLVFETFLAAASDDGVGFKVVVNDKEIVSGRKTAQIPISHNLDLTAFADQDIILKFCVEKIGNLDNDWYYWVNPLVIYDD